MMNKFFQIVRVQNLLIILLIGWMAKYAIFTPIIVKAFPSSGIQPALSDLHFILLALSILLITASGNLFNDIQDLKTDLINKPEKVKYNSLFSKETALNIHHVFNLIGLIIAFYLSYELDQFSLTILFIVPIILLRVYSTLLKSIPFIGNLTIALLAALVPFTFGLFESIALEKQFPNVFFFVYDLSFWESPTGLALGFIIGISIFSGLYTLIREIIKDVQDLEGDKATSITTIATQLGIKKTKIIIVLLIIVTILLLILIGSKHLFNNPSFPFAFQYTSGIIALSGGLIYQVIRSENSKDFGVASLLCKVIMIAGTLYGLIFWMFYQSAF